MSRSVLVRMKNISDEIVEKLETHISCSITFYFENRAVSETWENVVERGRPQMIWCMRIACWIPGVTNPHAGCAILHSLLFQCNNGYANAP